MTDENVARRLTTIVAADVAGYSRLISNDEEGTLAALRAHRAELIDPSIAEHRGRIANTAGDSILAEFPSVVHAVQCAIEIQQGVADRNMKVPAGRRLAFRIGVNIGDVIDQDGDLLGNGVNVAARLEGLAEPGGICISDDALRQLRSNLEVAFGDGGIQHVKNIPEPVHVWHWSPNKPIGHPTEVQRSNPILPDKPSIAVLPFDNMSRDEDQQYFADGLTEDLITDLSKSEELLVMARNSSFAFRGGNIDIQEVGKQLGVRYVLEGSIRRSANRLRITAQLIDASTSQHIWAERFDGSLEDVFELQDEITSKIVGQLLPKLELAEIERSKLKDANEVAAYDFYLRALQRFHAFSYQDIKLAFDELEAALASDPDYAPALALWGVCSARMVINRWDLENERQHIDDGLKYASRAPLIAPDDATVLWMSGFAIGRLSGDYRRGIELLERAKALNPNSYYAFGFAGLLKTLAGEAYSAISDLEHAVRLNPIDPRSFTFHTSLAYAYNQVGRYADAKKHAETGIQQNPRYEAAHREYVVGCQRGGDLDEARASANRLISTFPYFSLKDLTERFERLKMPISPVVIDHFTALREAGLPEE